MLANETEKREKTARSSWNPEPRQQPDGALASFLDILTHLDPGARARLFLALDDHYCLFCGRSTHGHCQCHALEE